MNATNCDHPRCPSRTINRLDLPGGLDEVLGVSSDHRNGFGDGVVVAGQNDAGTIAFEGVQIDLSLGQRSLRDGAIRPSIWPRFARLLAFVLILALHGVVFYSGYMIVTGKVVITTREGIESMREDAKTAK